MKLPTPLLLMVLTVALGTGAPVPARATEDLGYDFYNGKSNKIARVFNATPVAVQVIYENDKGSRVIPRNDLPPELKAKYPYDAEAAAAFIKNQAKEVQARNATQKQAWQQRELELKAKLDALNKQLEENKRQIHILTQEIHTKPHDKTLRAQKVDLLKEEDDLQKRLTTVEAQLAEARHTVDTMP